MAHRNQLKPYHDRELDRALERPNVFMYPVSSDVHFEGREGAGTSAVGEGPGRDDRQPRKSVESDGVEEPFRGFPEVEVAKAARRKRKASVANLPAACPRRSKRNRKINEDPDFTYQ